MGVLFSRLAATTLSDRSQAHARAEERRPLGDCKVWSRVRVKTREELFGKLPKRTRRRRVLPRIGRSESWFLPAIVSLAIACFGVTSCATTSHHEFSDPTANWHTKSGQLMYRTDKTTLMGDVLVRFSKGGDFELSLSKGPVTLLTLRQDSSFAEVKGPFAKGGWSGPVEQAPKPLRALARLARQAHSLARSIGPIHRRQRNFSVPLLINTDASAGDYAECLFNVQTRWVCLKKDA